MTLLSDLLTDLPTAVLTVTSSTWDAGVAGLEVGHQLARTRVNVVQRCVGYRHVTRRSTRALPVELRHDVGRASDAAVVLAHAASEAHSAIARRLHEDDVTWLFAAARVERLPLTELGVICTTNYSR